MKKAFASIAIVILFAAAVFAAGFDSMLKATSSGEQTSDAAILSGVGAVTAVHLITDGSNAATLTVHDGTSNSDKKIGEFKCNGSDYYCGWLWTFPVMVGTGIYCDVTGTDASYIVEYIKR